MGYKTIFLSEEAYKRLLERKISGESFSDVVIRITGNATFRDFVGLVSSESCDKFEAFLSEFREIRGQIFREGMRRQIFAEIEEDN